MKTIVITGASRGIGRATARHLSAPDRRLVLIARGRSALMDVSRELPGPSVVLDADMSVPGAAAGILHRLEQADIRPTGWVLNAGMSNGVHLAEAREEAIERELRLNYLTPLHLIRSEMARQDGRTSFTVVASLTSVLPFPGNATYAASKAALFSLVRSARLEARASGLHLGVVLPGYTDTEMTKGMSSWLRPMSADAVGCEVAQAHLRKRGFRVPGLLNRAAMRMFSLYPIASERLLDALPGLIVAPRGAADPGVSEARPRREALWRALGSWAGHV